MQRARILTAMVEVCAERGVGNVTVAHVVALSGVSRRTFYEQFSDQEDCLLAAFDDGIARAASAAIPAYERPGRWRERIRAGLVALLAFFDSAPAYGRFLLVESLGAGQVALERRGGVLARLIGAVDEGRSETGSGTATPPPLAAAGVVGGVLSVLHGRLLEKKPGQLLELTGPLMSTIVLPYEGAAAARRELERPVPETDEGSRPQSASNPLHTLGMRLTYRTVRVLIALAEHPGSSNRMIGDQAGIQDRGQASKLLGRLRARGLIENVDAGAARGEPNAWRLTATGEQVTQTIGAHAHNMEEVA